MKKKISLEELKRYYNGNILNRYVAELLKAKKEDYIIVPITDITTEYFNLNDNYIEMLIRVLSDLHYFDPIEDRPISQDLVNEIINR